MIVIIDAIKKTIDELGCYNRKTPFIHKWKRWLLFYSEVLRRSGFVAEKYVKIGDLGIRGIKLLKQLEQRFGIKLPTVNLSIAALEMEIASRISSTKLTKQVLSLTIICKLDKEEARDIFQELRQKLPSNVHLFFYVSGSFEPVGSAFQRESTALFSIVETWFIT